MTIQEMNRDLKYSLFPDIWCEEVLGFIPDDWQKELLLSPGNRFLLNCSRQAGKSTISAAISLNRALFFPGSLILLVSPTERQSKELLKKIKDFLKLIPDIPPLPEDNKLSLEFFNGSRIIALPGNNPGNIRGYSAPALVIEDEAAQCSDELYTAILPMLAISDGKLMLLSTPYGRRGHYFEAWNNDPADAWTRVQIDAYSCSRISDEFLQEQRLKMSEWQFKQEYLTEFADTIDSIFSYEVIQNAMADIPPLFPEMNQQKPGKYLTNKQPLFPGGITP